MTGRSSSEARRNLQFLSLEEKQNVHYGVHIYKLMNGQAPVNQTKIINLHKPTSQRIVDKGILKPPAHKTQQFEMTTLYKAIDAWNKIPKEIKLSKTTTDFKNKLQNDACKKTH